MTPSPQFYYAEQINKNRPNKIAASFSQCYISENSNLKIIKIFKFVLTQILYVIMTVQHFSQLKFSQPKTQSAMIRKENCH